MKLALQTNDFCFLLNKAFRRRFGDAGVGYGAARWLKTRHVRAHMHAS